jgi:hypothetical protein
MDYKKEKVGNSETHYYGRATRSHQKWIGRAGKLYATLYLKKN